jgi:hypothetical protein
MRLGTREEPNGMKERELLDEVLAELPNTLACFDHNFQTTMAFWVIKKTMNSSLKWLHS